MGSIELRPVKRSSCPRSLPLESGALDGIVWDCEACEAEVHRVEYRFEELQRQLRTYIRALAADEALRTCKACGVVMDAERGFMWPSALGALPCGRLSTGACLQGPADPGGTRGIGGKSTRHAS
ncbi:MAG: hypothetical protein KF901_17860 [Myxococcales bacterium]|nr:hypothetical protein [Myxococcales bacterium]